MKRWSWLVFALLFSGCVSEETGDPSDPNSEPTDEGPSPHGLAQNWTHRLDSDEGHNYFDGSPRGLALLPGASEFIGLNASQLIREAYVLEAFWEPDGNDYSLFVLAGPTPAGDLDRAAWDQSWWNQELVAGQVPGYWMESDDGWIRFVFQQADIDYHDANGMLWIGLAHMNSPVEHTLTIHECERCDAGNITALDAFPDIQETYGFEYSLDNDYQT